MKTVKDRLFPTLLALACCLVVGLTVSQAFADDEEGEWEMEEAMFEIELMNQHLEMFQQIVGIVEGMTEVSGDPTSAAVMALMSADDLVEEPGDKVALLEAQLEKVQDPAVRRAIRLTLTEAYIESGQPDKATENIGKLMQGKH